MKTRCLAATEEAVLLASGIIKSGGLVAFPTETVYGLGADALNGQAVLSIFAAKGRPADNPLIVHVSDRGQAARVGRWNERAGRLADAFWPGPLTLLLPKDPDISFAVSAGLDSIAVRMPGHPVALRFIEACGTPVAAPSANLSGRPSPTEAAHVLSDLDGRIPLVLDGGPCSVGLESTVLDLTGREPLILRPGAVTPGQIAELCGSCLVADSVMRPLVDGETAPSPGMRHRHYAPRGKMTLFKGQPDKVAAAICEAYDASGNACILAFSGHLHLYGGRRTRDIGQDAEQAAQRLFLVLRSMDASRVDRILCETLPDEGIGLAVMNRLMRAAAFDLVNADSR